LREPLSAAPDAVAAAPSLPDAPRADSRRRTM
jgi:hypothetical protein